MKELHQIVKAWSDYEILDSGNNQKLERCGKYILVRPETQAIWPVGNEKNWAGADAIFSWQDGKGSWRKKKIEEEWVARWKNVSFVLKLTNFKHIGFFPEQAANWEWIERETKKLESPKILNLFGYTGIASIVAALNGGQVTHVDASKQSNSWAKHNADISKVPEGSLRFILDDCLKFIEREKRRGAKYDGIILDPPAFGRGPKGEVWKIEEKIAQLLLTIKDILSDKKGAFFLLNGYAAGYSPLSFKEATESVFGKLPQGEYGELELEEKGGERRISSGIYVRFVR